MHPKVKVVLRDSFVCLTNFIRQTLYPQLEDNESVKNYPNVRGMAKNLFFFHHTHAEGGDEEESMSKYNNFEVM